MLERLFSKKTNFAPISQSEDCESSSADSSSDHSTPYSNSLRSRFYALPFFLITALISTTFGAWLGSGHSTNLGAFCTKQVSQYSLLMSDVEIKYEMVRFNGSLLKENIYREDASPEVDAEWEALGVDYRAVIVPTNVAAKSGLTPDQVQVSEKYGGGFPANVEGLHHLHCLNLLRKSLYYNFDYYHELGEGAFKNDDRILRFHVSHCLDVLRQQLMCTVDVAVLGQIWWNRDEPTAYPDFNTNHKCRNFEDVRAWAEAHQAPKDVPDDYLMNPRSIEDVYEVIP